MSSCKLIPGPHWPLSDGETLLWVHTLWLSLDPAASEAPGTGLLHSRSSQDAPTISLQSWDDPLACRAGTPPLTCRARTPLSPAEPGRPPDLQSPDAPLSCSTGTQPSPAGSGRAAAVASTLGARAACPGAGSSCGRPPWPGSR